MEPLEKKYRTALWFAIVGDLGYLSHRDTLTLWQRVIARAQLPVKFSRGFNPHMRLSLPLPRSVGMVSDRELLLLELSRYVDPKEIQQTMSCLLPEGIRVVEVEGIAPGVSMVPLWAQYRLKLSARVDTDRLEDQLKDFHESDHSYVDRPARGRHPQRRLDFRQQLDSLELHKRQLHFRVRINPAGTVRVNEVCRFFGLTIPEHISEVKRKAVGYPMFLMATA